MSRSGKKQAKRQIRAKVVAKKMQRRTSKERVKVAAEILKLQQLGAVSTNPDLAQLSREAGATRDGLNNLIRGFNKNAQAFADAAANLDARIGALMLVGDDLVSLLPADQTEVTTYEDAEGKRKVHWEAYIKHYVDNVRALALKTKEAMTSAADQEEDSEEPIVFGGNHEAGGNG